MIIGSLWCLDCRRHELAENLAEINGADAFVMVDFDEAFNAFVKMS